MLSAGAYLNKEEWRKAVTYYQLGREKAKQGKSRKQVEREYPDNHSVLIGFDDWQMDHK